MKNEHYSPSIHSEGFIKWKACLCDGPQEGGESDSRERVAAVVGEVSEEVEELVPQPPLAHQHEEDFEGAHVDASSALRVEDEHGVLRQKRMRGRDHFIYLQDCLWKTFG